MSVSAGLPAPPVLSRASTPSHLYHSQGYDGSDSHFPGEQSSRKGDPLVASALRSLNLCPSAYNTLFFSRVNIETLQRALRNRIQAKLGYGIDRQDENALCVIMRAAFANYGREPPCADPAVVAQHVAVLNGAVVKLALPQVASGVVAYVNYLRDASQLPKPLPMPINASNAGTKNLPIFSGL